MCETRIGELTVSKPHRVLIGKALSINLCLAWLYKKLIIQSIADGRAAGKRNIWVAFSHVKQMPHRKEDIAISYGAHSAT